MSDPSTPRLRELERGFRRAGVPNFIEDYSARSDVFTRALPVLTLVFLLETLNALDLRYAWWVNVLFLSGGAAIALGAFGALNVLRGTPFLSRPSRVGTGELAIFVAIPSLLPLIFGGQWRSSIVTIVVQLMILGLVYLVVGFGLFPIVRWAGARFEQQLRASLVLLVRALPLLLFFALVTFFTTEFWQMFATVSTPRYVTTMVLFGLLGAVFLLLQIPTNVAGLERDAGLSVPLTRPQRWNVGLVLFISQALQILFVVAAVWLFFMVFGTLLASPVVQRSWMNGVHGVRILDLPLIGTRTRITAELVRVATGTSALSGLYYAVAMVVDGNYRDEFVTKVT
ncbi:MAG: hypothetical protein QOI81_872, partial [Actinomycetota bacterium]|nr:hypothetical protein [Actinomycetota bacterium]